MPTPRKVYRGSDPLASGTFLSERKVRSATSSGLLADIKEQAHVLYYAALVCGPRDFAPIDDTRWTGFCPIRSNGFCRGGRKTLVVDHRANRWFCSACRKGGDVVDLVKAIARCDHDMAAAHVLMSAFRIPPYAEDA